MRSRLLAFFLLCTTGSALAQDEVGFYMVIHVGKKNCSKVVQALNGRREFCLAPEPIISRTEFKKSTLIQASGVSIFIDVTLTAQGYEKFKAISRKLEGTEMALVIENNVVGLFRSEGKLPDRTIRIGEKMTSAELDWAYQRLK